MTRLIQLSRAHWLLLATFLGGAFPLVLLITFMPSLSNWYAVTTLAPRLERDLGFRAAVSAHDPFFRSETLFVTEIKPDGAFDRAGVRIGDVPMDVHHGSGDFYRVLENHRGGSVDIRFLRISSGPTDSFPVQRRFTVIVPQSVNRGQR
jgi:hypothetical protein